MRTPREKALRIALRCRATVKLHFHSRHRFYLLCMSLPSALFSLSGTKGQLAGPATAALAQELVVPNWPNKIMCSTGNQQCFNLPGELSAPIPVNPTTPAPLASPAKSVLTRTPEAIYKEMNKAMGAKGISFPSGFPKSRWKTTEEAKGQRWH